MANTDSNGKIVFCTANAANYFSRALVFAESVKKQYKEDAIVICCLVEKNFDFINIKECGVIDDFFCLTDLDIPDFQKNAFSHNLLEMSCFVRPFLLEKVFQKYPHAAAYYYMDCDTWLNTRLYETDDVLVNKGYNIALTPHTIDPPDSKHHDGERIHERAVLRHGTFNLGFLGIANTQYAKDIITVWWKDRVLSSCYWDICDGVFVDQKWWNPVPYMFDSIYIETSHGYNYASWSIMRRNISKNDGVYYINSDPLRFSHFSATFNGHLGYAPVYGIEDRKIMLTTLSAYCKPYYDRVKHFEKGFYKKIDWTLGSYDSRKPISDSARIKYRKELSDWIVTNPFSMSDEDIDALSAKAAHKTNVQRAFIERLHVFLQSINNDQSIDIRKKIEIIFSKLFK